MNDRRHLAVVGLVHVGIDAEGALLQAPVFPHAHAFVHDAVATLDRDSSRQLEHVPDPVHPWTDGDDDIVTGNLALVGHETGDGPAVGAEFEARHLDPGHDADAFAFRLRGEAMHRGGIVRVAALLLMQHAGDAPGLPVVEQALHVFHRVLFALDEHRGIADGPLLLVDRGAALVHHLGRNLHVADGMVAVGPGVAFPHPDRVGHELPHGRLEIVVANDAAGDAGSAGCDRRLVQHQNVATGTAAGLLQPQGQVVGRAEAMNSRTDDGVLHTCRHGHPALPCSRRSTGWGRRRLKRLTEPRLLVA